MKQLLINCLKENISYDFVEVLFRTGDLQLEFARDGDVREIKVGKGFRFTHVAFTIDGNCAITYNGGKLWHNIGLHWKRLKRMAIDIAIEKLPMSPSYGTDEWFQRDKLKRFQ